ncbi:unnamed protein product [Rhizophagus irregularis]|nr:unnamed protein product [Rhizophagus irregularis]
MSTSKSYPGQQYLISYLNERGNKSSYYGFLNSYNNVLIVASTFSDSWQDLNNTWISHFLEKIEKLDLNQKDFKRKVCYFFILQSRVTPKRAWNFWFDLKELLYQQPG